jgi:hypothetical protein
MSLTQQHMEEGLSLAYVQAISAKAGVNFSFHKWDYGIDGTFHSVKIIQRGSNIKRRIDSGYPLDFQLKASIKWTIDSTNIVFDLESKTFNDLIDRSKEIRATPCILMVYCLPKDENLWLKINEKCLLMQKCCYWMYLTGQMTDNKASQRIRIPRTQILTPNALLILLEKVKNGELQ